MPVLLGKQLRQQFYERLQGPTKECSCQTHQPIICKDHSRAVADAEQRKANAIAVQNALTFQEAAVDKAPRLKTVYWLAKEEVASMKFPSLMQLLTMFGDPDVHHLRAEDPA